MAALSPPLLHVRAAHFPASLHISAMSVRHYTTDELLALRNSPLVTKPDDLPSIEQWLEFVYMESDGVREKLRIPHSESANAGDQRQHSAPAKEGKRNQRLLANTVAPEASPMGAFSTGRPTLGTRNSTLRVAAGGNFIETFGRAWLT